MLFIPNRFFAKTIFSRLVLVAVLCWLPVRGSQAIAKKQVSPHPLINKIWDVRANIFIPQDELMARLEQTRVILVGERHGHAEHQFRENFIIEELADRQRYPALALEMLEPRQSLMINSYRKSSPEYAGQLGSALQWWNTGWPAWSFYEPIFQTAMVAKLDFVGADLPKAEQDRIKKFGLKQRPADMKILTSWKASMKKAHCNLIKEDRLLKLALLQWQRDLAMAQALKKRESKKHGIVLLAGLAHIRKDRGVPRQLIKQNQFKAEEIVTVALMDVQPKKNRAKSYSLATINKSERYDYLWFTKAKPGEGTCARLKKKGLLNKN